MASRCCCLLLVLQILAASSFQWSNNPLRHHHQHAPSTSASIASANNNNAAIIDSNNNILIEPSPSLSSLVKSRWASLLTLSAKNKRRGGRRGDLFGSMEEIMGDNDDDGRKGDEDEEEDDTEFYSAINNDNKSTASPKPPPSRTPKSALLDEDDDGDGMTMKDVDEALNDEIVGALRSAEQDLMGQSERGVEDDSTTDENINTDAFNSIPPTPPDVDVVVPDEEELLLLSLQEAQREADEAEEMLRQAEEEAAKWEKELAQLEEEAARNSMAEAYQAALDAANENVDTLSSQIQNLESELASTISKMEQSIEDKERISAEYAFLAKNYGELKSQQNQGSATTTLLEAEIANYKSQIGDLESQLETTGRSLNTAQEEATKWQGMYNDVQTSMQAKLTAEVQATIDQYELQVLEVTASLEEEKAQVQEDANRFIDKIQSEFNAGIVNNQKMISALRQALRKTRKEKSYLEEKSSMERNKAVEDVRERMNSEVANLKEVLKSIEGEMGEKEKVMQSVMEGKEETEKLMEEIRILRQSFEESEAKSAQNDAEYEQRLSSYVDIENALRLELDEKERTIEDLMKDRDATTKQVEVLKLELEVLQNKVNEVQTSNSSLARELTDAESVFECEKSAMESQIASTEQKIADLEEELKSKQEMISTSAKALEEALAKLSTIQEEFDKEAASVKKLENELKNMEAMLAEAEASQQKTASQEQEASTKQIQSLQSRANSLEAQLKEATDNAARSEQKLKDYQAKVDSMQGTLMQSSTNVQARENELAAMKEQARLSMAEQAKKNEQLQSELNRVQKEMNDSLAKANAETAQRGRILEEKEKMLVALQEKYNRLLDQMESANVMAQKKIDAQAEQIRKLEVTGNQELSNLSSQVSTLKKDLSLAQGDAQKRITALNNQIQTMEQEIKKERAFRDEARQNTMGLEQALIQAKKSLEKMDQEKKMEVMQLNLRIEQSNAAAMKEAENSKRLRSDLKAMSESLTKADDEIKQRDSSLRTKESALSELQRMNEQLKGDIVSAQDKSQNDVKAKSDEINALKDKVATLAAEVDKEIKLRQDVMAGKEGVESLLQKKFADMTKDMESIRVDAQKSIDQQSQELKRLEASTSEEKNALAAEISRLKNEMSTAQSNAQKTIDARTAEIRNMEQVIAKLKSTIEEEKQLADEAMQGKSGLEKALQMKIAQLSNDIANAQNNVEAVVQEKNRELEHLNSQIKKLTEEVKAESSLKIQATKERDNIDHQLKAKIAQLEKELSDSRATNELTLKERDNILSTMRADSNKLTKLKDDAQKERDDVEKELTAKNYELRNKISTIQITADKAIQAKSEEVASLKMQVLEKAKSSDALINDKVNVLATVEDSLRAKTQLVEQLSKDIKAIRADADSAAKAEKQALNEKASIESKMRAKLEQLQNNVRASQANAETAIKAKEVELRRMEALLADLQKKSTEDKALIETKMQAELEQLRTDLRNSRANAEATVAKLQEELSTQQLAMKAQAQAIKEAEERARLAKEPVKDEAGVKSGAVAMPVNRQEKVQQTNPTRAQEPPKGFGKPAMKAAATGNVSPPKNIRLRDRITFGKVEQLREARLANQSAATVGLSAEKADPSPMIAAEGFTAAKAEEVRLERLRIAEEVAMKLKMEKERKTSGGVNSLRQLVMPQGSRNNVSERAEDGVSSSQDTKTGRAGGKSLLTNLITTSQVKTSPTVRASSSVPEKTIASSPAPTPSSQGVTSAVGAPSFPKRNAPSPPSSQALTRRQGTPASQTNSPASTIMGSPAGNGPLTGLLKAKGASSSSAFPKREKSPSPSSQAAPKPSAELTNPSVAEISIKSKEQTEQVKPPQRVENISDADPVSKLDYKRRSLKDLLPSVGKPIGSYGGRMTTTKLGVMATPEQPQQSSIKVAPAIKKTSLKNLLPIVGKPTSSYGKTTTTSLGGRASPEQAAPSIIERRKTAVREDVIASVAKKKDDSVEVMKATVTSMSSNSNLSSIIRNQNRRQRVPRDQPKLGETTPANKSRVEVQLKPEAISTVNIDAVEDKGMNAAVASMKIQEAFQRALLSARIANDAKAKIVNSFPAYRNANLSQMVQDQSKPTLSQQKAFANSNRRTSLFPEKVESHLSRLLHK